MIIIIASIAVTDKKISRNLNIKFFSIEFQNIFLSDLPREAVLVAQVCVKTPNNYNLPNEKCLAWASKVFYNENLYVLLL
jgi:hypothetical protein